MPILVVNAGSSSLKLSLLGADDAILAEHELEGTAGKIDLAALESVVREAGEVDAVGHRVVHGGPRFDGPVRIDDEVEDYLRSLTDLAPLHQKPALEAIGAVRRHLPAVPAIACFDTAFHHSLPAAAATYAIPLEWRERWSIRRYGFHGLSHAYASRRAAALVEESLESLRIVSCHLGSGSSLAAIKGGRSVDTTMGFTPLEGLVMGTRAGTVDPGLVLWLVRSGGLNPDAVNEALEKRSGLLALAGTADMREVLAAGGGEALEVYLHRLRALIAAMAAAMGGLDLLVFTGGIGEHAAPIRSGAADGLGFLGVALDEDLNRGSGDRIIGRSESGVRTLVVAAREDLEIARQVRGLLAGADPTSGR
ncbi:MAG: acetate/propionate family kinase [Candidatus Dormibacteraeota bacterium]|nr:acetate/propionate family kinase [Candidatus Dormibacteraeota bacterium]